MGDLSENRREAEQRTGSVPSDWEEICTFVAQIIERNKDMLKGYFYNRLRDKDDAEDLLQDTLVRLLDNIKKYGIRNIQEKPEPVLWRCARAAVVTLIRRRMVRNKEKQINFPEIFVTNEHNPLDGLTVAEIAENINSALSELHEHEREALVLRHYKSRTFKQIAEKLGLPYPRAAYYLVKQAEQEMKKRLSAKGITDEI